MYRDYRYDVASGVSTVTLWGGRCPFASLAHSRWFGTKRDRKCWVTVNRYSLSPHGNDDQEIDEMGRFAYRAGLRFNGIELVRLEPRTWACRCHCGSEFKLKSMTALRIGTLKSCGCNSSERFSYAPGQRFNDIELLRQVVGGWVCRCHCGNEFTVENMTNLRLGKRKSCGCTRVPYRRTSFFSYAAGQRYGGIELVRMDPRKWVCRCHCWERIHTHEYESAACW